ncbi:MAG: FAD-dependent oxidoreductase [Rubrivivax sp.]|nr:FAD-dependent oxidoreductase [Rubrivivax sp.]
MRTSCDYLIIGGGSAGCVLAARLSEDPRVHVTLLEAGGEGRSALVRTPAGVVAMLPTRLNNWALQTVPQPGLGGRRGYQPRGKALGGSSAINAMLYVRGHRSDYDRWATLGNPGWSWDEVLPYFVKAEHNERLHGPLHGRDGPLRVSDLRTDSPWHARWIDAAASAGHAHNPDFNGPEQDGFGAFQVTQQGGERCSAARAYLDGARRRPNLQVVTGAQVQRLALHGRRVIGAEARVHGRLVRFAAQAEVIVCAGALHSPQLLMVSGIGDPRALRAHGIEPLHVLPGVGHNLQDHVDFVFLHASGDTSLAGVSLRGLLRLPGELLRWSRQRRGLLSTPFAECGGFLRLSPRSAAPDIQLLMVTALVDDHARRPRWGHGLSCHTILLRPRSRGEVGLAGPTMDTPPRIDPRYYSDPRDLDDMVAGYKLARRVLQQPALARHLARDLATADVRSDEQIREVLRQRSDTVYHPVGTCRMGPAGRDPLAVVDTELRVHGLHGLRVVDASVMPTIPGGNTNAPTIMVAERAADLIRHGGTRAAFTVAGPAAAPPTARVDAAPAALTVPA